MALLGLLEILLAFIGFLIVFYFGNPKGVPRNWPVLGMLPDTLLNLGQFHDMTVEILSKTGNFTYKGPWFSGIKILNTVDPANIHYIMSSNFPNFPKGDKFLKIFNILGDGIFNSDDELWKNQRKLGMALINHRGFHRFFVRTTHDKLEKGLVPILEEVAEKGLVLDLQDLFQRFTFDITCLFVTGYDPGCLAIDFPEVRFSRALDNALEAIFYRHITPEWIWKLQGWLGFGPDYRLRQASQTMDSIVGEYIERKRQELSRAERVSPEEEEDKGIDLMSSYMKVDVGEVVGRKNISEEKFLRDTTVNFLLAGRDTTSSGLSWFFYLLSKNPQVEKKIIEELEAVIPPEEKEQKRTKKMRIFTAQELSQLNYLHGALNETLRLYPPVPLQHKSPLKPDVLPTGHRVDPETEIIFSLYTMGRMKSIWGDDCREFKPERWISERGKMKHEPSYKFLAFNAGPRTCIGKEVAIVQMKAVAASIVYNFRVEVVEGHPVKPKPSIILHMKHGLKVRVASRWNA